MAFAQRIESLKKRHADIDHKLHQEEIRPAPDELKLHSLKRLKLNLKDEIERLVHGEQEEAA